MANVAQKRYPQMLEAVHEPEAEATMPRKNAT